MPQQSKFTGVLARLKQPPPEHPAEPPSVRLPILAPARGKGRPPGKRSDPDYQPTTLLLRKETKKTAVRLLEDAAIDQDLSELTEQLLADWIRQHQA
jgi:hypothetical protein